MHLVVSLALSQTSLAKENKEMYKMVSIVLGWCYSRSSKTLNFWAIASIWSMFMIYLKSLASKLKLNANSASIPGSYGKWKNKSINKKRVANLNPSHTQNNRSFLVRNIFFNQNLLVQITSHVAMVSALLIISYIF